MGLKKGKLIRVNTSSLNKRAILKTTLGLKYSDLPRVKWWLRDESIIPMAQCATSASDEYQKSSSPHNIQILKARAGKQFVLRIKPSELIDQSFVVKVFILHRLKYRLKYHALKYDRFAFAEAANLIIASQRGLNVPKLYGYGTIHGFSQLVKKSVVIREDLSRYVTLGALLKLNREDEEESARILSRTIPMFIDLYQAACNHIDMNLDSIMLSGPNSKQKDFILDFEFAQFHDEPSLEILMFEAAFFANRCSALVADGTIKQWRARLLNAIQGRDNATRRELIKRFNYYLSITQPHTGLLRRKERIQIG